MTGTKTQTKTKPFPSAAAAAERSATKHSSGNNNNKTHKTKTSPITPPWTAKDELEMARSERSIPEHSSSPPAPSSDKSRQVGIRTQAPADHEQAADRNPSATSLRFPSLFFPSTLLSFATGRHESSLEMRTRDWDLAHSHGQLAMARNEDLHRSTSVCSRKRSSRSSSRSWARRCAGKDTREKKESVLVVHARKTEAYRPTAHNHRRIQPYPFPLTERRIPPCLSDTRAVVSLWTKLRSGPTPLTAFHQKRKSSPEAAYSRRSEAEFVAESFIPPWTRDAVWGRKRDTAFSLTPNLFSFVEKPRSWVLRIGIFLCLKRWWFVAWKRWWPCRKSE